MYLIFSKQLRMLDLSRVVPFGDDDLMYICDKKIALKFSNIISEKGAHFSTKYIMEVSAKKGLKKGEKSVFGPISFSKRHKEFWHSVDTNLERYFDTDKIDYLFFDKKEQTFFKKRAFGINSLSAIVYICLYEGGNSYEEIDITELSNKEVNQVLSYLTKLHIRDTLTPRESYSYRRMLVKRTKEARKKFAARMSERKVDRMKFFFERYKKLPKIETKIQYKKYFRALMAKYHPDKGGAHETFVIISEDNNEIQKTSWYSSLL